MVLQTGTLVDAPEHDSVSSTVSQGPTSKHLPSSPTRPARISPQRLEIPRQASKEEECSESSARSQSAPLRRGLVRSPQINQVRGPVKSDPGAPSRQSSFASPRGSTERTLSSPSTRPSIATSFNRSSSKLAAMATAYQPVPEDRPLSEHEKEEDQLSSPWLQQPGESSTLNRPLLSTDSSSFGLQRSIGQRYTRGMSQAEAAAKAAAAAAAADSPSKAGAGYNPLTQEEEHWLESVRAHQMRAKERLNVGLPNFGPPVALSRRGTYDEQRVSGGREAGDMPKVPQLRGMSMRYAMAPPGGAVLPRMATLRAGGAMQRASTQQHTLRPAMGHLAPVHHTSTDTSDLSDGGSPRGEHRRGHGRRQKSNRHTSPGLPARYSHQQPEQSTGATTFSPSRRIPKPAHKPLSNLATIHTSDDAAESSRSSSPQGLAPLPTLTVENPLFGNHDSQPATPSSPSRLARPPALLVTDLVEQKTLRPSPQHQAPDTPSALQPQPLQVDVTTCVTVNTPGSQSAGSPSPVATSPFAAVCHMNYGTAAGAPAGNGIAKPAAVAATAAAAATTIAAAAIAAAAPAAQGAVADGNVQAAQAIGKAARPALLIFPPSQPANTDQPAGTASNDSTMPLVQAQQQAGPTKAKPHVRISLPGQEQANGNTQHTMLTIPSGKRAGSPIAPPPLQPWSGASSPMQANGPSSPPSQPQSPLPQSPAQGPPGIVLPKNKTSRRVGFKGLSSPSGIRAGASSRLASVSSRLGPSASFMKAPSQRGGGGGGGASGLGLGLGLALQVGSFMQRGVWDTRGEFQSTEGEEVAVYIPPGLQQILPDDLTKLKELGRGCFGSVWLAMWCGVEVALKELHQSVLTDSQQAEVFLEAERLASLRHPCVIAFYGIVTSSADSYGTVVEFLRHGSLRSGLHKLSSKGPVSPKTRAAIALQAARGMEYLHFQGVVHFDLKSENLLCDLSDINKPVVKIGDLGLSKLKQSNERIRGKMLGTLPWMAPELFPGGGMKSRRHNPSNNTSNNASPRAAEEDGGRLPWLESGQHAMDISMPPRRNSFEDELDCDEDEYVTEKVDVYSFGICLWEIWTLGELPYSGWAPMDLRHAIMSGTVRPDIPADCDGHWVRLMQDCWAAKPHNRPSFTEVAQRLEELVQLYSEQEQTASASAPAPATAIAPITTSQNGTSGLASMSLNGAPRLASVRTDSNMSTSTTALGGPGSPEVVRDASMTSAHGVALPQLAQNPIGLMTDASPGQVDISGKGGRSGHQNSMTLSPVDIMTAAVSGGITDTEGASSSVLTSQDLTGIAQERGFTRWRSRSSSFGQKLAASFREAGEAVKGVLARTGHREKSPVGLQIDTGMQAAT